VISACCGHGEHEALDQPFVYLDDPDDDRLAKVDAEFRSRLVAAGLLAQPHIVYATVYAIGCASVHYLSCRERERCEVPDEGTRIRYEVEFLPPQQSAPARPTDSDFFVPISR
jgi:hypothetical protein